MNKKSTSSKTTKKVSKKEPNNNKKTTIKISSVLKNIFPSLTLSVVFSFMFYIFEPITMYATNPDDFWFDIYEVLPTLLQTFYHFYQQYFIFLTFNIYLVDK